MTYFRIFAPALALAVVLLLSGCASGTGPSGQSDEAGKLPPSLRSPQPQAPPTGVDAAVGKPITPRQTGMPQIPDGAQWTIYCRTIAGPDHVGLATRFKEQLIQQTKMPDWYVIHQDGQSTLYYGFYRSFNSPGDADSARAQRDRKLIDNLTDRMATRPFKYAFFVALDSPDPVAPVEWNLANAKGDLSLQIAAYTGSPLRKQYAIDAVRAARSQGLEAYFYHGESTSSVCVGAFPASALTRKLEVYNSTGDFDQPVFNSTLPLSRETAGNQVDAMGRPIKVEQERIGVRDPALAKLMEQFPTHAVNGEVQMVSRPDPATGKTTAEPASSFIVPIPHAQTAATTPDVVQPLEPQPLRPPTRRPGEGALRRIGE